VCSYGPKRADLFDSRRFGPSTFTCARILKNLAHVNVLGKEITCWVALHLARMVGPLVWLRQRSRRAVSETSLRSL